MSRKIAAIAAVIIASGTAPVAALDLGSGFTLRGKAGLEYNSNNGAPVTFGTFDADLSYRMQGDIARFGFDIGGDAAHNFTTGGNVAYAIFGGLVVGTSYGEFTFGAPRGAATLVDVPSFAGSELIELQLSISRAPVFGKSIKFLTTSQSYGAQFIGSFAPAGSGGQLRYGVSGHRIDSGDFTAYQVAAEYTAGATVVEGAVEFVTIGPASSTNFIVGATHDFGAMSGGLYYQSATTIGNSSSIRAFGSYQVTDAISVTGDILHFTSGAVQTVYGISGRYDFNYGAYANLAAIIPATGGQTLFSGTLGLRF